MTQSANHWTILGAGAIGHLLACRFAQNKIPATLVFRNDPPTNQPLVCYRFNNIVDQLAIDYQPGNNIRTINNLLLTVKSHQVKTAVLSIRDKLSNDS